MSIKKVDPTACDLICDFVQDVCEIQSSVVVRLLEAAISAETSWNGIYAFVVRSKILSLSSALHLIVFIKTLSEAEDTVLQNHFDLQYAFTGVSQEYDTVACFSDLPVRLGDVFDVRASVYNFLHKNKAVEVIIPEIRQFNNFDETIETVLSLNLLDFDKMLQYLLYAFELAGANNSMLNVEYHYLDVIKYYDLAKADMMDYTDDSGGSEDSDEDCAERGRSLDR